MFCPGREGAGGRPGAIGLPGAGGRLGGGRLDAAGGIGGRPGAGWGAKGRAGAGGAGVACWGTGRFTDLSNWSLSKRSASKDIQKK